jgi:hypothetical protein
MNIYRMELNVDSLLELRLLDPVFSDCTESCL